MTKSITATTLPGEFAPLFWDVDIQALDTDQYAEFIIARILEMGRPEHVRWVMEKYTDSAIISAVKSSDNITRKTANFWAIYYDIPREEIRCFRKS
ncbi:MAG: hypothetical protein MAGBODY4_01085 [Candidatus Marinimicrobia bacterium]|nr:hypothetical protein [Candidatus Neomarinimicrobiota bacterium]